jgi:hypothetical protein
MSSMETMVYVPRNVCQFKVCKTAPCILFTWHCLAQRRICRLAAHPDVFSDTARYVTIIASYWRQFTPLVGNGEIRPTCIALMFC